MIFLILAAWSAAGAAAQTPAERREPHAEWRFSAGAGGLIGPAYEGDDSYRLSLLPNLEVAYGNRFSASIQNGARYRVVDGAKFRTGPVARIAFSRSEDGVQAFAVTGEDTSDLRGLGDVDAGFELGGFAEYEARPIKLSAELRQALSGHGGTVADFAAAWSARGSLLAAPVIWSIGPRARIADDGYVSAHFGVDARQAAASGLPAYEASGGLYSYGIGASLVAPITFDGRWTAVFVAGYDRLTGDAGDSPLVRERGSPDKISFGAFLSRRL